MLTCDGVRGSQIHPDEGVFAGNPPACPVSEPVLALRTIRRNNHVAKSCGDTHLFD